MFSVIIPVYNTPLNYLERCISSISSQLSFDDEIILVNDGSKDSYTNELINLCKNYPIIKYIEQMNSGVSIARNRGIQEAKQPYLIFVDGDDVVSSDFIEEGKKIIFEYPQTDFILGDICYVPGELKIQGNHRLEEVLDINALKRAFLRLPQDVFKNPILGSPCGRIYKTSIAKNVKFPEGVTHWEDQIFNRLYFNQIQHAVISGNCWYLYYQNDFSAMHNHFNSKYIEKAKPFWTIWHEMNELELNTLDKKKMYLINLNYFFSAVHINLVSNPMSWKEKMNTMDKLLNEQIFLTSIKALSYSDCCSFDKKVKLFLIRNKCFWAIYLIVYIKALLKGEINRNEKSN